MCNTKTVVSVSILIQIKWFNWGIIYHWYLLCLSCNANSKSMQSVTNTFFFDRIRIPNIIRFSEIIEYRISNTIRYWEIPNTEYQILFGIEQIWIPNTKYFLVLKKSEYQIQIVLFGLTIWIPNTKYRIVYKILEKKGNYNQHICLIKDILF